MSSMGRYVTSPKGIGGKMGGMGMIGPDGHSPIMPGDFGIHIRNPFSPLDKEINEAMIKP